MAQDPFSALAKLKDPEVRAAVKQVLDEVIRIRELTGGIGAVTRPLAGSLDAAGNPLTRIADPADPEDAVNLRTLQQYIQAVVTGAIAKPPDRPAPIPDPFPTGYVPPPPAPPPTGPVPPPPPPGDPTDPGGPPVPTGGPYPPPQAGSGNLRTSGKLFYTPGGSIYRWKSCTDFRLLKMYLDGEAIAPILADRTGEGATMVRVLGMATNLFDLNPANYPNYLLQLPVFASVLAAAGLDLELTVFADAQALSGFDSVPEQQAWLVQVRDALLASPNVVFELVNEYWQNGVNPSLFTPVSGIIASSGSGLDYGGPNLPPWDYAILHTSRDAEWPRKAKDAMEWADLLGRPAVNDEPMGANEIDLPGRRSNVPNDFYYYAAVSMLLAAGATFHSEAGLRSQVWGPIQRQCAQSFYGAINAIPASVLTGRYTAGHLSDCPLQHDDATALRTFARYTATEACAIVVRPTGAWVAVADNGWTITGSTGPDGCMVFLSK